MSGKLDQSLDEILSTTRRAPRAGIKQLSRRTRGRTAKPAVAAPVGGVKKNPRGPKTGVKAVPTGPSGGNGESKIVVSNLPKDVTEVMVKEYFVKAVGPIKKVEIAYGPGGVSRGVANVIFVRPDSAAKAAESQNGVLVDGKSMKIEIILDAKRAAAIPPPKGLGERITQPKSQPKSAAATPSTRGKATRGGRAGKAKNARPAKKTAEELDSEMMDYFNTQGEGGETAGVAAQPAANGDANMDDEIL